MKTYIGIDVSKESLSVAIPTAKSSWQVKTCANSPDGIRALLKQLPSDSHCVLKATGSYSVLATYMICRAGVPLSVINPKQSHYFAKMHLSVTKTDSRDAVVLAEYGRVIQPADYQIPAESLFLMRQKRTLLRQYQKQRVMLKNIQESFSPLPFKDTATQENLSQMLAHFDTSISQIKGEISTICKRDFEEQYRLLTSITGISETIATALIEATNGFLDFSSAKALAKFVGIAPTTYQSGKVNQSHGISRAGNPHLRSLLYVGSCRAAGAVSHSL